MRIVMSPICSDSSRSKIHIIPSNSIDYNRSLCDESIISEVASFYLRKCSCASVIPERSIPSNMSTWADFTVFPKIDIAFYIGSRF